MIDFTITRFEVQHGALCALGYVTADCMSRKPAVSCINEAFTSNSIF